MPVRKIKCAYAGCGKRFIPKSRNHRFCSRKCQESAAREQHLRQTEFEIFAHDNFRCQYCGRSPKDGAVLTVDHIYPQRSGGKSDRFNLITACRKCNSQKNNKLLPKDLILESWEANKEFFTYQEARDYWENWRKYK